MKNIVFLFLFVFLIVNMLKSQDLILDAQQGLYEFKYSKDNISEFDLFERLNLKNNNDAAKHIVSQSVTFELNTNVFKQLRNEKSNEIRLKIPVDSKNSFTLVLDSYKVHSPRYLNNATRTSNKSINDEIGNFYHGYIDGNKNSKIAVSIFKDYIRMLIIDENGNYVVGRIGDTNRYMIYNDKHLVISNNFKCHVDDNEYLSFASQYRTAPSINSKEFKSTAEECVDLHVEVDYHTFQDFNSSVSEVNNYVSSLVNEVSILYEFGAEKIELNLDSVFVHTSTDPYENITTNLTEVLFEFGTQKMNETHANLYHLISSRQDLGQAGIAWQDVICDPFLIEFCKWECNPSGQDPYFTYAPCSNAPSNCPNASNEGSVGYSGSTAVSFGLNYFNSDTIATVPDNYSWEVNVFAHEMGHNFGSPHTHACKWNGNETAIDGCGPNSGNNEGCNAAIPTGGTIMSYCQLPALPGNPPNPGVDFNLGFGQQPWDLIYDNYVNASCTSICPADCIMSNLTITSGPTCAGSQIQISLQFDVSNGSGTYKAQLFNDVVTLNSTITDGTVTETILLATSVGMTTLKVYDDTDNTCFDEVMNVNIPDCTCSITGLTVTSGPTCVGPDVNFGISFNPVNSNGPYAIKLDGSNIGELNATSGSFTVTDNKGSVNLMVTDINATGCSANTSIMIQECGTCSDGIKNQGESGVDCGGPCSTNCPCTDPDDKTYTNQTIPNGTDEFVNDWILTTGTVDINNGSTVNLRAGNYIELMPGFEIKVNTSGSVLMDIEPCIPN